MPALAFQQWMLWRYLWIRRTLDFLLQLVNLCLSIVHFSSMKKIVTPLARCIKQFLYQLAVFCEIFPWRSSPLPRYMHLKFCENFYQLARSLTFVCIMEDIQISSSRIMVESEISWGKCRNFLLASWFMSFRDPFECLYWSEKQAWLLFASRKTSI